MRLRDFKILELEEEFESFSTETGVIMQIADLEPKYEWCVSTTLNNHPIALQIARTKDKEAMDCIVSSYFGAGLKVLQC